MILECFVAFDTETTGLGPEARILEVAAVQFYKGKVVREWSRLLHPNGIEWEDEKVKQALAVNHLTFEMIMGNPLFEDIRCELLQELSEEVWVAHNTCFDIRMIEQEMSKLGECLEYKPELILDTVPLDYRFNPGQFLKRKLGDVCQRWGVVQDGAHRAVADAKACGDILWKMVESGRLPTEPDKLLEFQREASLSWQHKTGRAA